MTEDDTFRILAHRISFYEMMKMYRNRIGPIYPNNNDKQWHDFLTQYGWTWKEFAREWTEWNGGNGHYSDYEMSKRK